MTLRTLSLAAAVALIPAVAFAQGSSTASRNESDPAASPPFNTQAPQYNNSHAASGTPARDGCVNVPGEAHNSADCSRIDASDGNTAMNSPSRDLAGRPTGTTENADRNARVLSGQAPN
jgi:hypothetical protein